ncbi:ABC transporter permease [Patulibacter sp.]|uniref:ABC transporter permease n=1 Tax=Patulibacter sp. TaxID=1912859 RepID=UPI0027156C90|nr:ABC transporter permease [Patulibacter sp.]MDO9408000.1 ABC transporter permease [Patulibacter sp.]
MSTQTVRAPDRAALPDLPPRPGAAARYVRETLLLVGRQLRSIPRVPERLSDVTIQPVIFTLLFLYVFGSAIAIPGTRYQDYLLPGLVAQSIAFGVIGAGTATATDFSTGVIDRFRSLPVSRLAVITAQVIGQVLEQILGLAIVIGLGLALGWRPDVGPLDVLLLVGLVLLGLIAFTWFGVLMGMLVRSSDAMQGVGFAIVLPLSFLAGTFVPIEGMDAVPRFIGEWDPLSTVVAAIRYVSQGTEATGSWPLEHPVIGMVLWCALIIGICVPLALRRFRTTSAA